MNGLLMDLAFIIILSVNMFLWSWRKFVLKKVVCVRKNVIVQQKIELDNIIVNGLTNNINY